MPAVILDSARYSDIVKGADCIRNGGVVVAQTDTNYGVFCSPYSAEACERLYEIKGREATKPLTLFVANGRDWEKWGTSDKPSFINGLVDQYWPGPLNLILQRRTTVADWVTAGGETVSIVHNKSYSLNALIALTGLPLAATSANLSGTMDSGLVTLDIAREHLGDFVDYLLDSHGTSQYTTSSTIVDLSGHEPKIVRQGDLVIDEALRGFHVS